MMWLLLDDRAGNNNQVKGLALALGMPYEEKHLQYNIYAKLPNFIRGASLLGLKNKQSIAPIYPKIVISAGRKAAPIARYIKKQSPETKLVQIMSPESGSKDFSYIILPQHDLAKPDKNVITTIGSLHQVNTKMLAESAHKFEEKFAHLSKPYVGVLIGGATKGRVFSINHAQELAEIINSLIMPLGGSLLITSSRRTPLAAIECFLANLKVAYYHHDFNSGQENPYWGYLGLAEYFFVTGDSISMISECCATGGKVFIYRHKEIMSPKHLSFIDNLCTKGYAANLSKASEMLTFKPSLVLEDTAYVAQIIKNNLFLS
jgi:uncharacterized protein